MARSPIEIALASETKAFKQGIEIGVIKPLEDAIKRLRELGDNDGADKLEASLKDAQKATERLAGDTKIAAAKIEREYRDAYRSASRAADGYGDAGEKANDRVKDGAREVQAEFGQNMGEAVSSFRGDLEDLGQIGQDTLGGLAGTLGQLGGVGALAGAGLGVAAAAVGSITDAYSKAKEATDEARDSAYQYGLTVAESGKYADVSSRLSELTGSVEGLKRVQDLSTASGWQQIDVVKALATGDGLPALTRAFQDHANETGISTSRNLELQGALEGAAQGFNLARDAAGLNQTALYDLATAAGKATGEVDDLGNKIIEMPGGKKVVVNAETRTAYEDLDAIERRQITQKQVEVSVVDRASEEMNRIVRRLEGRTVKIGVTAQDFNTFTKVY
ncbi:hypothetical protein IC744_14030 [Microbacterium hominis]|uniref:hypothetical protein n=1 Tax=Microbacterium TaxID=33882 RepID=UPI00168A6567|nr:MULTISPECIES: hypothetical protein [Microbacterium]QOC24399.1 hypothetical protein IC745_08270 [Microbacterium hominis]QOC28477.1 hypothetical protein IC744_14030 [Microbacterium hominis]QYF96320.1 hypothetical protein KY498_08875 [Microbacterium sp. PAMC21962]